MVLNALERTLLTNSLANICLCEITSTPVEYMWFYLGTYQGANRSLTPHVFYPHWHLYEPEEAPSIDPVLLIQDPPPV